MNSQAPPEKPDVYVVTTLEQARLLADEFKLKLLQAFAEQATTVKQVAAILGEKPTRLYRHVDALLEAGLLQIVQEIPKRGTVERTLQAVASRFEADPSLFDTGSASEDFDPVRDQFRAAADSFVESLSAKEGGNEPLDPICLRVLIRGAKPARLRELRALLVDWIELASKDQPGREDSGEKDSRSANAMIVFHES